MAMVKITSTIKRTVTTTYEAEIEFEVERSEYEREDDWRLAERYAEDNEDSLSWDEIDCESSFDSCDTSADTTECDEEDEEGERENRREERNRQIVKGKLGRDFVLARDVRAGDTVYFEGDPIADPDADELYFQSSTEVVTRVARISGDKIQIETQLYEFDFPENHPILIDRFAGGAESRDVTGSPVELAQASTACEPGSLPSWAPKPEPEPGPEPAEDAPAPSAAVDVDALFARGAALMGKSGENS